MKATKLLTIALALSVISAGCSKSNSTNSQLVNPAVSPGIVPGAVIIDPTAPPLTTGGTIFSGGSTSTFNPVSLQTMNKYVATRPLNNPTNFKINVNLASVGSGRYGGTISISYIDNGIQYNGEFKAGLGRNQSFKGMYDNNTLESEYNYWFNFENKLIFTGFFEDQYGAITISLEPMTTTPTSGNDAEPILTGPYRGTVYFKNFAVTTAPHSPYRACWFTSFGPYDCRSNVIQTKCGVNPGAEAGYEKLGTFDNININQAFNIN